MKRRRVRHLTHLTHLAPLIVVSLLGLGSTARAGDPAALYNQITDPKQRLYFRTLLGRPDGKDMVYYWRGKVFISVPGDLYKPPYPGAPGSYYPHGGGNGGTPAFGFEGYNIRRVLPDPASPTDFVLATREITFYTDPQSGAVLTSWTNPLTGKTTPVVPVLNEYLFSRYRVEGGVLKAITTIHYNGPSGCQSMELSGAVPAPERVADHYAWGVDVFPSGPLNKCGGHGITDPMGLKNGTYTSSEHFDFYVSTWSEKSIELEQQVSSPHLLAALTHWTPQAKLSWARTGPWLPWMCLSEQQHQGRLIYHARSELLSSWSKLPQSFKAKLQGYSFDLGGLGLADWKQAPTTYVPGRPWDTSWSVFHDKVLKPAAVSWSQWCAMY